MATLFTLPLQVPVSSAGRPYAGAYAYFYAAGTTTHQIVYSDIDLTTAHAQPVVADAYGRFPAIYLNPNATANYRVQIKTSASVLIYDQDDIPKDDLTQSAVASALWPATVTETDESVTIEDYAYPPGDVRRYYDGGGDYATAISNALKSGEVVNLVPNTNHPTASAVTYTGSCVIRGQGATISPNSTNSAIVIQPASSGVSTTLSADAQINVNSITVTSATGFAAGDLIRISSTAAWHYNPSGESMKKGELHRIQAVSGTTFTLDAALSDNYDVSGETVTVEKLTPVSVVMEDFTVSYAANTLAVGVGIYNASGSVRNVTVKNAATQGIFAKNCYGLKINCDVRGSNRTSLGYGVQASECYDVWVHDSSFSKCRRGVDFTGVIPTRRCGVVRSCADGGGLDTAGSALTGDNSGFGTHEPCEFISFDQCVVSNVKQGFLLRGANLTVNDCEGVNDILQSFAAVNRGVNVRVTDSRYSAGLRPIKTLDVVAADDDEQKLPWFVFISNPEAWDSTTGSFIHIEGNQADDLKNGFVNFAITTDSGGTAITEVNGVTVQNNRFTLTGSTATTTCYLFDSSDNAFTLKRSYVAGNVIRNEATTFTFAHADLTLDSTVVIRQPNSGAASVADGGTITHGHIKTPTTVQLTASTAGEFATVTSISSTTVTVAIKKHDNSAGTTQTVYWTVDG